MRGRTSLFSQRRICQLIFSLLISLVQGDDLASRDETPLDAARRYNFVTRPDIHAFKFNVKTYHADAVAPGYWFVAPYEELAQSARGANWVSPLIYDHTGELVWSGALFDTYNVFDMRPIVVDGENMMTGLYPREEIGYVMDSSYRFRKMLNWLDADEPLDMHEFNVFDNGRKAMVLRREDHYWSKEKSVGLGFDGECRVLSGGVTELDITTSPPTTLFNWSMVHEMTGEDVAFPTHRNTDDTDVWCTEGGWDATHCNAVDRFPNGDYLISCRHLDMIWKVSRATGKVVWRLGGRQSDFEFDDMARFSRQHFARVLDHNDTHTVITLFDNARSEGGDDAATHDYSRGLVLSLHDGVAQTVVEYPRPDRKWSPSRGSMEILENGNVFMGWTFESWITEHAPDGQILMEAKLPHAVNTYRSYKAPWVGRPADPPDLVSNVHKDGSTDKEWTEVHVSWNGATEVVQWDFYESNTQGERIRLALSEKRRGFETSANVDGYIAFVIAVAVDKLGRELGQSKAMLSTPLGRNPLVVMEEQEWLQKHMPYMEEETGSWEGAMSLKPGGMLLAYLGGLCTFLMAAFGWVTARWLRERLQRRRWGQRYTRIDKMDLEDVHSRFDKREA